MPQKALRFAVRTGDFRSATWKLWTEAGRGASEVYLVCRRLGGVIKTSLHESGSWHVAFEKDVFEKQVEGVIPSLPTRFVEKWSQPVETAPGFTLAYRIVVPAGAVTSQVTTDDSEVTWLPNAPAGMATEIDIFLVSRPMPEDHWPGKLSMNTSLVGSFQLDSGVQVFVIHWVVDMPVVPKSPTGSGTFFKGVDRSALSSADLRAIAFGSEPDGSRTIFDFGVRVLPKDSAGP